MFENIEKFKEYCEKLFKSTSPIVDKDEARAGVLGYHPLALLVIALDYIEELENMPNKITLKAFKDAHGDKNLITFDSVEEMFREVEKEESSTE